MPNKWKVIGISGVTCGGKTSLAVRLLEAFAGSVHLNQDDYFRAEDDPNHEWISIGSSIRHQNWECLSSVDWQSFSHAIRVCLEREPPNSTSLLIIEGHIIFNYRPIADLCERKFFVTLSKDQCFERRHAREYLPKDPHGYDQFVWDMYVINKLDAQTANQDIVFIDGSQHQNTIYDTALKNILA